MVVVLSLSVHQFPVSVEPKPKKKANHSSLEREMHVCELTGYSEQHTHCTRVCMNRFFDNLRHFPANIVKLCEKTVQEYSLPNKQKQC